MTARPVRTFLTTAAGSAVPDPASYPSSAREPHPATHGPATARARDLSHHVPMRRPR
jgi:hypothetical protein